METGQTTWRNIGKVTYNDTPDGIQLSSSTSDTTVYKTVTRSWGYRGYSSIICTYDSHRAERLKNMYPEIQFSRDLGGSLVAPSDTIVTWTATYEILTPKILKWLFKRSNEYIDLLGYDQKRYKDGSSYYHYVCVPFKINPRAADNSKANCFKIGFDRGEYRDKVNDLPRMVPGIWYEDRNIDYYGENRTQACIMQVIVYENTPEAIEWLRSVKVPKSNEERRQQLSKYCYAPGEHTPGRLFTEYDGHFNAQEYATRETLDKLIEHLMSDEHYLEKLYGTYKPRYNLHTKTIFNISPIKPDSITEPLRPVSWKWSV